MEFTCKGQTYRSVLGSDVGRDGMYLEVSKDGEEILEIFHFDETGEMIVTAFQCNLPIELVEFALLKAREILTP